MIVRTSECAETLIILTSRDIEIYVDGVQGHNLLETRYTCQKQSDGRLPKDQINMGERLKEVNRAIRTMCGLFGLSHCEDNCAHIFAREVIK
jgi:hypothetical protein